MAYVMTSKAFVAMAKKIATDYKTLYVHGCFGAPMTAANKIRYCKNTSYNAQPARQALIKAASANTFGFDCVCLIKGILWGWDGNAKDEYGGAVYKSHGVPDVGSNAIMDYCTGVSTNFSGIQIGELVHMTGHVGIYIGDGLAVECTPIWKDGVQITAVGNIGKKSGYNTRTWTNHGKLKFIDYSTSTSAPATPAAPAKKPTLDQLVDDTIKGVYGSGAVRKSKLNSMYSKGQIDYNYDQVQKAVNEKLAGQKDPLAGKSDQQLAQEVIAGKYGSGQARKNALGSRYAAVQKLVDQMMAQPVYHTVVKGDTLSALAKKYGTTVAAIQKLNNIKNANVINIGQKIRIK